MSVVQESGVCVSVCPSVHLPFTFPLPLTSIYHSPAFPICFSNQIKTQSFSGCISSLQWCLCKMLAQVFHHQNSESWMRYNWLLCHPSRTSIATASFQPSSSLGVLSHGMAPLRSTYGKDSMTAPAPRSDDTGRFFFPIFIIIVIGKVAALLWLNNQKMFISKMSGCGGRLI